MKRFVTGVLFLAGALALQAASEITVRKSPELAFKLPAQGDRLLSQYRGKVVALEFILTTCPHCQAATQVMNRLQEHYGGKGFQAIDVAIDPGADALVENFIKDHQVKFPVGWTPMEAMMAYMGFTERSVVPQLILIDREGNIHYETPRQGDSDSMREEVIEKRVQELLDRNSRTRSTAHR